MIPLHENEQILAVAHRHWIVLLLPVLVSTIFFVFIISVLIFAETQTFAFAEYFAPAVLIFLMTIIGLVLLGNLLYILVSYWLDVLIITSDRILHIDQVSLFRRKLSEFGLGRVQDITVLVPSFIATLFDFGSLTLHTAGESRFTIFTVPRPEYIKDIIMTEQQKKFEQYGRSL